MAEISDALHKLVYSIPKGDLTGVNLIAFGTPGSSMHQLFRANKAMFQFKNHEHGVFSTNAGESVLNAFWAATTAYHHVRDWAKKDPLAVELGKDWNTVVEQDSWLRRCKNLANASKHSDLDYDVQGWPPELECKYGSMVHTVSDFFRTLELRIDGETLHPADFLDHVMRAWIRELQDPILALNPG